MPQNEGHLLVRLPLFEEKQHESRSLTTGLSRCVGKLGASTANHMVNKLLVGSNKEQVGVPSFEGRQKMGLEGAPWITREGQRISRAVLF